MGTVLHCRIRGVLAGYEAGFRLELASLGYTPSSIDWKVGEAGRLSRWMTDRNLTASDLDDSCLAVFVAEFAASRRSPVTRGRFEPLLRFLRSEGAGIPESVSEPDPAGWLMDSYQRWMTDQRGLAARTMVRYEATARRFLARYAPGCTGAQLGGLAPRSATDFLLGEVSRGLSSGSLSGRASELRSLLRFLYVKGLTAAPLTQSIPAVPGWRAVTVPPRIVIRQGDGTTGLPGGRDHLFGSGSMIFGCGFGVN